MYILLFNININLITNNWFPRLFSLNLFESKSVDLFDSLHNLEHGERDLFESLDNLEHGDEGEHSIQESTRIGHQQLLLLHL